MWKSESLASCNQSFRYLALASGLSCIGKFYDHAGTSRFPRSRSLARLLTSLLPCFSRFTTPAHQGFGISFHAFLYLADNEWNQGIWGQDLGLLVGGCEKGSFGMLSDGHQVVATRSNTASLFLLSSTNLDYVLFESHEQYADADLE